MLDKLINDLKSKFNAKKKGEETESSEEESDELHEDHEEDQDSDADTQEALPKDDSKKKNSLVIKIVLVLAIGYLAYDYLMPKEEEVSIDQMVQNTPKPKRKKPKREEAATTETANTEAVTATEPEAASTESSAGSENMASSETSTNQAPASEPDLSSAPIENINVSSALGSESSSAPTPTPETNTSFDQTTNTESSPPAMPAVGESSVEEVKVSDLPMSGMGEGGSSISSSETNEPNLSTPKETSLSSKIETVSEYVNPPKYETLGRGLVYNCKGKHWACVDKENYQVCFKNMKWNADNGKSSECVTQNVYANEDDCGKVQRYNVSTNVETSFCKN